jgi:hypothetical protein
MRPGPSRTNVTQTRTAEQQAALLFCTGSSEPSPISISLGANAVEHQGRVCRPRRENWFDENFGVWRGRANRP